VLTLRKAELWREIGEWPEANIPQGKYVMVCRNLQQGLLLLEVVSLEQDV
jgi:hypothetical protein